MKGWQRTCQPSCLQLAGGSRGREGERAGTGQRERDPGNCRPTPSPDDACATPRREEKNRHWSRKKNKCEEEKKERNALEANAGKCAFSQTFDSSHLRQPFFVSSIFVVFTCLKCSHQDYLSSEFVAKVNLWKAAKKEKTDEDKAECSDRRRREGLVRETVQSSFLSRMLYILDIQQMKLHPPRPTDNNCKID